MSFGPCLCGDIHCWSCGPAQGYHKCPACGLWNDDENEAGGTGCVKPEECQKAIEESDKAEAEAEIEVDRLIAEEHGHPYDPEHPCVTLYKCRKKEDK